MIAHDLLFLLMVLAACLVGAILGTLFAWGIILATTVRM